MQANNVADREGWPRHGQQVIFVDPRGVQHPALVTAAWGPRCVNVVFVDLEDGQRDNYGQKLKRFTSVMHKSVQEAHGNYWHEAE
ncbi:hypothetical protein [Rhizobium leguminosarum]